MFFSIYLPAAFRRRLDFFCARLRMHRFTIAMAVIVISITANTIISAATTADAAFVSKTTHRNDIHATGNGVVKHTRIIHRHTAARVHTAAPPCGVRGRVTVSHARTWAIAFPSSPAP